MHFFVLFVFVLFLVWTMIVGPVLWSDLYLPIGKAAVEAKSLKDIRTLKNLYILSFVLGGPFFWLLWVFGIQQGASEFFAEDAERIRLSKIN